MMPFLVFIMGGVFFLSFCWCLDCLINNKKAKPVAVIITAVIFSIFVVYQGGLS